VDIDPARVATWGWSAGATLSAEGGLTLGDTGTTPVAAMVGWSGGYDFLDFTGATPRNEIGPLNFLGCDPMTSHSQTCLDRAQNASAARNITAATPPMTLWNSSHELVPISQWQDMRQALNQAHIPNKATALPGTAHATQYTHQAYCATLNWLTTYLGPYAGTCVAPPNPPGSGE
jgi:acetyl esterase/lipase